MHDPRQLIVIKFALVFAASFAVCFVLAGLLR